MAAVQAEPKESGEGATQIAGGLRDDRLRSCRHALLPAPQIATVRFTHQSGR